MLLEVHIICMLCFWEVIERTWIFLKDSKEEREVHWHTEFSKILFLVTAKRKYN